MIRIRHAGYVIAGYDVITIPAAETDNQGEPCGCGVIDAVNECTMTFTDVFGVACTRDCCRECVAATVVMAASASHPITVEMLFEVFIGALVGDVDVDGFQRYAGPLPAMAFPSEPVTVVADPLLALLGDTFDDRMTTPDDMRPHPDAL